MLIDTHTHLLMRELGKDPAGAAVRAREAGVAGMISIGIDRANSEATVQLAKRLEGVWAAVGVHPNETSEASEEDWEAIRTLIDEPEVVAVGESGMDLYWDRSSPDVQRSWLERHAELALEHDLPLVLHVRDAFEPIREALPPFAARGLRGVMHCFGGGPDELSPFVDWGFLISFAGNLTYKSAEPLRQAAARVPREQCAVETDAPFLAPVPKRGRPNEPAYVVHTASRLAEIWGVPYEKAAAQTTANARDFFRLPS
jgi:TatD DNase family protein